MTNVLNAQPREPMVRGKLKELRKARHVPATIYGPEIKPISITVEYNPFEKAFHVAGESSLVEIDVAGSKHSVLVKAVQTHPVSGRYTHVDFYAVSMKKELEADAELEFVGESAAVKHMGGTLIKVKSALTIRCLPQFLVRNIQVSLAKLATFDDVITLADIAAPEGIVFDDELETVIAKVSAPLTEDQIKAMEVETAGDVSKVEVAGKKEEPEAAAGEEAGKEKPKAEKSSK